MVNRVLDLLNAKVELYNTLELIKKKIDSQDTKELHILLSKALTLTTTISREETTEDMIRFLDMMDTLLNNLLKSIIAVIEENLLK